MKYCPTFPWVGSYGEYGAHGNREDMAPDDPQLVDLNAGHTLNVRVVNGANTNVHGTLK